MVGADGGQVGEQAGEAVHRVVIFGAFARCLGQRLIGALGGRDGAGCMSSRSTRPKFPCFVDGLAPLSLGFTVFGVRVTDYA